MIAGSWHARLGRDHRGGLGLTGTLRTVIAGQVVFAAHAA
jgi:hypothetical protein